MPTLADSLTCMGCGACGAVCEHSALSLKEDALGFLNPEVDNDLCTLCGMCEDVCPVLPNGKSHFSTVNNKIFPKTWQVFGAQNVEDAVLSHSSSGGVFWALAKSFFEKFSDNAVVYGAAFADDFERAIITRAQNLADCHKFCGSKYLEAHADFSLPQILIDLKKGKNVLFTATPCKVAGLKAFLKLLKVDTKNLITVELICHGVAAPSAWGESLKKLKAELGFQKINEVHMRKKLVKWENSQLFIKGETAHGERTKSQALYDSWFGKLFGRDFALREACYRCPFHLEHSFADIQIGDFWGVPPKVRQKFNADRGVSVILCKSQKGLDYVKNAARFLKLVKSKFAEARPSNPMLEMPATRPALRDDFERDFKTLPFGEVYEKYEHDTAEIEDWDFYKFKSSARTATPKNAEVGIVTLCLHTNYGGNLQTFALQQALQKIGFSSTTLQFAWWHNNHSQDFSNGRIVRSFTEKNIHLTETLYLPEELHKLSKMRFKNLVVGSDQIWRRIFLGNAVYTPFLDFAQYQKIPKIAYAASFGTENDSEYSAEEITRLKILLKQFNALSTREDSGVAILKNWGFEAQHLLDPTLLLDACDYAKFFPAIPKKENFVFAYLLGRSQYKTAVAKRVADAKNLKLFEVNDPTDVIKPSVERWLWRFKNADFVVTDSFHGTVFSLIFGKPFISILGGETTTRFLSLAKLFDLNERLLLESELPNSNEKVDALIQSGINFDEIHQKIATYQKQSFDFLKKHLKH